MGAKTLTHRRGQMIKAWAALCATCDASYVFPSISEYDKGAVAAATRDGWRNVPRVGWRCPRCLS